IRDDLVTGVQTCALPILVVLYGARTPEDFCYRDETQGWKNAGVELRQVISQPDGHDWSGPTGYVQSLLDHVLPNLKSPVALICRSEERRVGKECNSLVMT